MTIVPAYLDHNATAPVRPEAAAAVADALAEGGNPSAVHASGRRARGRVETARGFIAASVGALPEEVTFTSGATEANVLAIAGLARAGRIDRLIVSAGEHDSVLAPARAAGLPLEVVPLTPHGLCDLAALRSALDTGAATGQRPLVAVMLANNETGVIQPIADIAALVEAVPGAVLHVDAVQGLARLDWSMASLGAHSVSLSAHKIGGPSGIGALIMREGLGLDPLLRGGGQELGRRAGTENVAGIAGFAAALKAAMGERAALMTRLGALRDRLEAELMQTAPEAVIFGAGVPRLANTGCFAVAGLSAETQVMALDLAGVAISAGAACSSGKVTPSHVIEAMTGDRDLAAGAIRVSLGWTTQDDDVARFSAAWADHYKRAGARAKGLVAGAA